MASAIPSTTSISSWNRATKHVEAAIRSGRYINAETALVFAGPPRITDIGGMNGNQVLTAQNKSLLGGKNSGPQGSRKGAVGYSAGNDALYPIGLLEQIGVQQAQNVQKMFEIGSRRSYQAAGRVQVMGSIGRVMFNGASLLRVLYAYYPNTIQLANGKLLTAKTDSVAQAVLGAGEDVNAVFPSIYFEAGARAGADPEYPNQPHTFFINLMSELFSHPFGMGVILRDNRNRNYGALYLEDCFITTHSWQISSSSTLITEAVNFQADAAVPMEFNTDSGALLQPLPVG